MPKPDSCTAANSAGSGSRGRFAALLGIEIVSAVPDKIVAEMMVRDDAAPGRLCYMVGLSWLLPTH